MLLALLLLFSVQYFFTLTKKTYYTIYIIRKSRIVFLLKARSTWGSIRKVIKKKSEIQSVNDGNILKMSQIQAFYCMDQFELCYYKILWSIQQLSYLLCARIFTDRCLRYDVNEEWTYPERMSKRQIWNIQQKNSRKGKKKVRICTIDRDIYSRYVRKLGHRQEITTN